jgi:hypothetical protein
MCNGNETNPRSAKVTISIQCYPPEYWHRCALTDGASAVTLTSFPDAILSSDAEYIVQEAIAKADTLIEALGWIRRFRDKVTVIKLGGSVWSVQKR